MRKLLSIGIVCTVLLMSLTTISTHAYANKDNTSESTSGVPNLVWNKTWGGGKGDHATDVVVYNGEIYVVGGTRSFGGGTSENVFLRKYDLSGTLVWNKTWGGSSDDCAWAITVYNGESYIVGNTSSFGGGTSENAFLLKYDSSGMLVWNKTWGGNNDDGAMDVTADDNGIYIVGYTCSFGGSISENAFFIKYASSGTLDWNKTWGGSNKDIAYAVAVSAGDVYLVGQTFSFGGASGNGFLLWYNITGVFMVNLTLGGSNLDYATGVAIYGNEIYIDGYTESFGTGLTNVFLYKYNYYGLILWNTTWCGSKHQWPRGMIVVNGETYIVGQTDSYGGGTSYNTFLLKYNSVGLLEWYIIWGGSNTDIANNVAVTNGDVYVVGDTQSFGVGTSEKAFLLKYTSSVSPENAIIIVMLFSTILIIALWIKRE
jgi:hypothetical protein